MLFKFTIIALKQIIWVPRNSYQYFTAFPTTFNRFFFLPSREVANQHASSTLLVPLLPSSSSTAPSCDVANKNIITPTKWLFTICPVYACTTANGKFTSWFNQRLMLFLRAPVHLAEGSPNTLVIRSSGRCNEPLLEFPGWWRASTISPCFTFTVKLLGGCNALNVCKILKQFFKQRFGSYRMWNRKWTSKKVPFTFPSSESETFASGFYIFLKKKN